MEAGRRQERRCLGAPPALVVGVKLVALQGVGSVLFAPLIGGGSATKIRAGGLALYDSTSARSGTTGAKRKALEVERYESS